MAALQLEFDFDAALEQIQEPSIKLPKQVSVTRKPMDPVKPVVPEILKKLRTDMPIGCFLSQFGIGGFVHNYYGNYGTFLFENSKVCYSTCKHEHTLHLISGDKENEYYSVLVYFDTNGQAWTANLSITLEKRIEFSYTHNFQRYFSNNYCMDYKLGEWKAPKHKKIIFGLSFLQTKKELMTILEKNLPYTAKWSKEKGVDVKCLLMAPYLEILCKAGFSFAEKYFFYEKISEKDIEYLNRLCQDGTKPKDIFKTAKVVYMVLKNETNMEIWDCYRRLDKTKKLREEKVQQVYNQGYDKKDLEYFNSILAKTYQDKPIFTWDSLIAYLGRLDTFEAICKNEAFVLLNDYLTMCNQLQMQPRIDGDSLKREHDIAARNVRCKRDAEMNERMLATCEIMKKYNYQEGVYFIRAIESHDDLLDEAKQQHNCVACYGDRIARGMSYIFVMRETAHPDKSLITIELSPNGREIRQKYLAYNKPIHNKSQSEFIERWLKHCRSIG